MSVQIWFSQFGNEQFMGSARLDDNGKMEFVDDRPLNRPSAYPVLGHQNNIPVPPSNVNDYAWDIWFEYVLTDTTGSVIVRPDGKDNPGPYRIKTNRLHLDAFPEDFMPQPNGQAQGYGHSCDWEIGSDTSLSFEPITPDQRDGLFAYDAVREGFEFASRFPWLQPGYLNVVTPVKPGVSRANSDYTDKDSRNASFRAGGSLATPKLVIGSSYAQDLDIIQHEYGHYIQWKAGVPFPDGGALYDPGLHGTGTEIEDSTTSATKAVAVRKNFFESSADFLSQAIQKETESRYGFYGDFPFGPGSPNAFDERLSDAWAPFDLNLLAPGNDPTFPSVGEDNRAALDRILRQAASFDPPNNFGYFNGWEYLTTLILRGDSSGASTPPADLTELYEKLGYDLGELPAPMRQVDCLFSDHGVAPLIQQPAQNSLLGRDPFEMKIEKGNSRPDKEELVPAPNDNFVVEVWNSDYSQLITFQDVQPYGDDNLRLPLGLWRQLWDAHQGETIHVTVAGTSSGALDGGYATGPYRSCAKTYQLLRTTDVTARYQSAQAGSGLNSETGNEESGGLGSPARGTTVALMRHMPGQQPQQIKTWLADDAGQAHLNMDGVQAVEPAGKDSFDLYVEVRAQGPDGAAWNSTAGGGVATRKSGILSIPVGQAIGQPTTDSPDPLDFTREALTTLDPVQSEPQWAYEAAVWDRDNGYGSGSEVSTPHTLMIWNANIPSLLSVKALVSGPRDAFEVYDVLVSARDYLATQGALFPSAAVVKFAATPGIDNDADSSILARGYPAVPSWDEVLHWYGVRWLKENADGVVGGLPQPAANLAENAGKQNGTERAWTDGWADYFAVVVQRELARAGTLPLDDDSYASGATQEAVASEFGGHDYTYDLAADGADAVVPSRGEDNSVSVARLLFGLYQSDGDAQLWQSTSTRKSLAAFFNAATDGQNWSSPDYRRMAGMLSAHAVAPQLTGDPGTIDMTSQIPATLGWTRGGGGPSYRNDVFRLQVLSADWSEELFSKDLNEPFNGQNQATPVTYTFSEQEWLDVKAAVAGSGGGSPHFVVLGRQSDAPTTPSPDGWYPGLWPGEVPLTGDVMLVMQNPAALVNAIEVNGGNPVLKAIEATEDLGRKVLEGSDDARVGLMSYQDWDCYLSDASDAHVEAFTEPSNDPGLPAHESFHAVYDFLEKLPADDCAPRVVVAFQESAEAFTAAVEAAYDLPELRAGSQALYAQIPQLDSNASDEQKVQRLQKVVDWQNFIQNWYEGQELLLSDWQEPPADQLGSATTPGEAVLSADLLAIEQNWRIDPDVERHIVNIGQQGANDPESIPSGGLSATLLSDNTELVDDLLTLDEVVAAATHASVGGVTQTGWTDSGDMVRATPAVWYAEQADEATTQAAVDENAPAGRPIHIHSVYTGGGSLPASLYQLAAQTGGTARSGTAVEAGDQVIGFITSHTGGVTSNPTDSGGGTLSVAVTTPANELVKTQMPAAMNFTAQVSSTIGLPVTAVEWDFHFDGGSFDAEASGAQASYTYNTEYTGAVAVRVTDMGGHTAIAVADVWANAHPSVQAGTGPWEVHQLPGGLTFDLTASTDPSGIESYSWDFDGNATFEASSITTEPTLTHVFTAAFDGPVRVRVKDTLGAVTEAVIPVKAYQAPTAVISGGPFSATASGAQFPMDGSQSQPGDGGPIVSWEWDFNNDGILQLSSVPLWSDVPASASAATVQSWRYLAPFDGTVRLTVKDAAGHEGTVTAPVSVISNAPALSINGQAVSGETVVYVKPDSSALLDVTATDNGSVQDITAQASGGGITKVAGSGGTGAFRVGIGGDTVVVTVHAVDNDGQIAGTTVRYIPVAVLPLPYPTASMSVTPGESCAALPCQLTFDASASSDADDQIVSYRWDFTDNGTVDATGASVGHTFTQTGTHKVLLEVTDAAGHRSYSKHAITVSNPAPTAAFTAASPAVKLEPVALDASASTDDTDIATYEWDFDNDGDWDTTSTSATLTHVFWDTAGSSQLVTLRVTDEYGAKATVTHNVALTSPPQTAGAALNGPYSALPGGDLTFDASATSIAGASITQYAWDFDGNGTIDHTSTTPTVTRSFTDAFQGTTWLRVTDSQGRYSVASAPIRVNWAPPTIALTHNDVDTAVTDSDYTRHFTFDATASHSNAPGGTITNYEWHFAYDWQPVMCANLLTVCNTFDTPEFTGADKSTVSWDFNGPINRVYTLTVTDSAGLSSTQEIPIQLTKGQAPTADAGGPYTCTWSGVQCKLTGPVSSAGTDPDGSITTTQWMFQPSRLTEPLWRYCNEGTGVCDPYAYPTWQNAQPDGSLTYAGTTSNPPKAAIEPEIRVKTTDNHNNTRYDDAQVNQVANTQSVQAGTYLPGLGYLGTYTAMAAEQVALTAHPTLTNATVQSYAWDVDNNGTVDATTNGTTPTLNWTYTQPGTYTAKVTATTREVGAFGNQEGTEWLQTPSATATVNVSASYSGSVTSDAPLGWWRLGETSGSSAADASGNGKHGTFTSGMVWLGRPGALQGVTDTAMEFQASSVSRIQLPNLQLSSQLNLTMEGWVKTANGNTTTSYLFTEGTGSTTYASFGLYQGKTRYQVNLTAPSEGGGAFTGTVSGTTQVNDGTWHHIAAVRTADKVTLYVDGKPDATWNATQKHQTLSWTRIGEGAFIADEAAVYTTALTGQRIALHNAYGKNATYTLPTAAAGVDVQAVTGAAVALNGSASTGSGLSYSWNFKD
ncbi:PKD domain-containing protein, partial [Streptomyces sp. NPDC085614]|uniref:PKD domain-containing protein n=1 Tax=Streptomyces sp. NPDC085614 TaxID=3365733 RepID=UPI0037D632AB